MTNEKKSPAALILLAWLVMGVPLGWGVYNTVRNSMKLFQNPAPARSRVIQQNEIPTRTFTV